METLHQPEDIINQRYRIVTLLGQGSTGITYEAEDLTNYQLVAIKAISLRQATNWKILELLEGEARVLTNLNHPGIPKYLDYFKIETPEEIRFYLVQDLIHGQSLGTLLEKGLRPTETQVKNLAIPILKILEYLHSFAPPVLHRNIKPQNIICRPEGKIYLADFGFAQDVYRNTLTRGENSSETQGYLPLEQFLGQEKPASDLYSLGATLLFLLTGKCPADLPQVRTRIDWRSQVDLSPKFARWLEKMLEPSLEDRFQSAKEALKVLLASGPKRQNFPVFAPKHPPPKGIRVNVEITERQAVIYFPPQGLGWDFILYVVLTIHANSFFLMMLLELVKGEADFALTIGLILLVAILGFYSFITWYMLLWNFCASTRIEVNRETFTVEDKYMKFKWKSLELKTMDIETVSSITVKSGGPHGVKTTYYCAICDSEDTHKCGGPLIREVQYWLTDELHHIVKLMQS